MNKTYKIVQIEPSLFQVLSCNGVEWYWEDAWREFQLWWMDNAVVNSVDVVNWFKKRLS